MAYSIQGKKIIPPNEKMVFVENQKASISKSNNGKI
jgi:hypothetical protein